MEKRGTTKGQQREKKEKRRKGRKREKRKKKGEKTGKSVEIHVLGASDCLVMTRDV